MGTLSESAQLAQGRARAAGIIGGEVEVRVASSTLSKIISATSGTELACLAWNTLFVAVEYILLKAIPTIFRETTIAPEIYKTL